MSRMVVVVVAAISGALPACSGTSGGGGADEGGQAVPPPGQAEVSGTATTIVGVDAVAAPLALPLTANVERGTGGATIEGALVGEQRSTVVWDGGRPLRLEGQGGLDLGPAVVTVDGTGAAQWRLDGAVRRFVPGSYSIGVPVAVGRGGLAEPRASVSFDADDQTTFESRGGATVATPPAPLRIEGPGSALLEGQLTLVTAEGTTRAKRLEFGPGSFIVETTPGEGGLAVTATLNGPLLVK